MSILTVVTATAAVTLLTGQHPAEHHTHRDHLFNDRLAAAHTPTPDQHREVRR